MGLFDRIFSRKEIQIQEDNIPDKFRQRIREAKEKQLRELDLSNILKNIKHYIQKSPHVGEKLPKTWVKVRQVLENDDRNYITLQEFFKICRANGFSRVEDRLQLSKYFHDLGVCLHFQDEENSILFKTVILNPEWGTVGVYKLLDNTRVINNQGCFRRDDLKDIWKDEEYSSMRGELLV